MFAGIKEVQTIRLYGISTHNLILLTIFLVVVGVCTVNYGPKVAELVTNPEDLLLAVQNYGHWGALIFIGIQIFQIVVPPIPGKVVQLAGGYIFGPWLGTLYLLLGALVGSLLSFYAARLIGFPLVRAFVSPKNFERLSEVMERSETDFVVFLAFLIPAFPKDLLTYVAGLTPISGLRFVVLGLAGRLPALFVSVAIGNNLRQGNYGQVVLILVVASLVLLVTFLNRKWILSEIESVSSSE